MPTAEILPPEICARFDVVRETVRAGVFTWSILSVRDSNRLVDAITPEQFAADERLPYWADLWPSSLALAQQLREGRTLLGETVLELGCGLGLAGIAATQCGARVLLTDYDDDALAFARANAGANLDHEALARVRFRRLDWRSGEGLAGRFNLVIGADIAYERQSFSCLLETIRSLLEPGARAILAEPGRTIGEDFLRMAEQEGFSVARHRVRLEYRLRHFEVVVSELRSETLP